MFSIWNSVFKRYRLGDFLCYAFYDEDNGVYINNDNTYGMVFECAPRVRMGIGTAQAMEELPESATLAIGQILAEA